MNYLDFLTLFLGLGNKLPAIVAAVQKLIADIQALVALVKPAAVVPAPAGGDLQQFAVSPEEEALEAQIVQAMTAADPTAPQAIGDGTFLRKIWAAVAAHPELLTFLLGLLK